VKSLVEQSVGASGTCVLCVGSRGQRAGGRGGGWAHVTQGSSDCWEATGNQGRL
jgi:hypothetical protein